MTNGVEKAKAKRRRCRMALAIIPRHADPDRLAIRRGARPEARRKTAGNDPGYDSGSMHPTEDTAR
jgi:hypothetical protein